MGNLAINVLKVNVLAGLFIYLVLLGSRIMQRRYSARWKYFMWLFISLFLLFPVNYFSDRAVIRVEIPRSVQGDTVGQSAGNQNGGVGNSILNMGQAAANGDAVNSTVNNTVKDTVKDTAGDTAADAGDSMSIPGEKDRNLTGFGIVKQGSTYAVGGSFALILEKILNGFVILWFAGIICVMIFRTLTYQIMMRKLKRWAFYVRDKRIRWIYRSVCREMGISHAPRLMKNAEVGSPLLAGLGVTYLFLSDREYTDEELRLVFRHELTHYKNKDLWYKLFLLAVRTIYWFNPYLYLMGREAEKDVEYICDSHVVGECSRDQRSLYQRLLVSTAAISGSTPCLSASLNDSMRTFKERLLYMTKAKKLKKGIVPVVVFSLLLTFSNGLIGCSVRETGASASNVKTDQISEQQNAEADEDKNDAGRDSAEVNAPEAVDENTDGNINGENPSKGNVQKMDADGTENEEPGRMKADAPEQNVSHQSESGTDGNEQRKVNGNQSADLAGEEQQSGEVEETEDSGAVKAKVKMYEGKYFDEVLYRYADPEIEFSPYCQFYISNVTDTSFDFEIYEVGAQWKETLIFKKHTAVFTGDGMQAVYNGNEYTLTFTFPDERHAYPDVVDMKVSGFGPVEGNTYVNNMVPGREFG